MMRSALQAAEHLANRCRRDIGVAAQHAKRWRQCQLRRRVARLRLRRKAGSATTGRLGISTRTLRRWRTADRRGQLLPNPLGRPCKQSSHEDKLQALAILHKQGPHLGLPTLRSLLPSMPRCQWRDLQRDYRQWWQATHRYRQQQLTWHRVGSVWAVDFSDAPRRVDGQSRKMIAVRDLASGMQLAWEPVADESALTAVTVLETLFRAHGAPLILKCDNGSAFISDLTKQLLKRWVVVPLYSPARTPRYNGSCEAGNCSMKQRTMILAIQEGRGREWTRADMDRAREQANQHARGRRHQSPTPQEKWQARALVTDQARRDFEEALDNERQKLDNQDREAPVNKQEARREAARKQREAVTQALVELEYLSVTWRSIPLPINAKKVANIM